MDGAADFLVAADDRIELALARGLRQIAGIFLQRVIGVLGRSRIGGAALAQRLDGAVQILWGDTGAFEDLAGLAVLLDRQRQQQALDGDETVTRLLAGLFGGVEHARQRRIEINLPGAAAGHLRPLGQRRLDLLQRRARIAAGAVDQAGRQPLRVVEQDFQHMFGGELLVALAQGQRLRGLHESARAVGIFLEIHALTPSAHCGAGRLS